MQGRIRKGAPYFHHLKRSIAPVPRFQNVLHFIENNDNMKAKLKNVSN